MRVATFLAGPDGDIEVALTAFPGDVGGMLANVNRWRGQMGLAPVDEAGLAEDVRILDHEGVPVAIVDLIGADGLRMLGAIVEPGDGQTWFLKATAESESLDAIESEFVEFARTIRMGDTVSSGAVDTGLESTRPAPDEMEERLARWTPPEDWAAEEGASPILSASYLTEGGARITVTRLRGDGGGDLANVNRWRGQLGLGPVETLDASAGVVDESPLVVDLRAPDDAGRMVAAIVPDTGTTVYFKMTGQPEAVETARAGFDRLVSFVGLGEPDEEETP